MNTNELIARLSKEMPRKRLRAPAYYAFWLVSVLLAYGVGVQSFLGLRQDVLVQLSRPAFALEILLLVALTIFAAQAAVFAMYPDMYQKPAAGFLPYIVFASLAVFMLFQLFVPQDARMVTSSSETHGVSCALCIASVAALPAALIFGLLRQGASIRPLHAGALAVLAAAGLGCLTLRLAKANDSLIHLVQWHYTPTLVFAALGAWAGAYFLRW